MNENNHNPRRVVVTGMGMVTALGNDVETTWKNLLAGKSGVTRLWRFDPARFAVQIAAQLDGFKIEDYGEYIDFKEARRIDPFIQLAVACTAQALKQSNLKIDESNTDDIGVLSGSGIGGFNTIQESMRVLS